MAGGLLRKWGLGVELTFNGADATAGLNKTGNAVLNLRKRLEEGKAAVSTMAEGLGKLAVGLAPIGAAFGFVSARGSGLAADLEGARLTMRVLLGDAGQAEKLLGMIRENAAATPFAEGDLIDGSKRLLRLTGANIDKNMEMLRTMELMAALSPGKTVVDATEALLDAASGGGFERLKEFGISMRAEDFEAAGRPGGEAWGAAVYESLSKTLLEKTRGEDLVGALSQTFAGRKSTFFDSIDAVLRGAGEVINARVGPLFEPFGAAITSLQVPVRNAFERLFGYVDQLAGVAAPLLERLTGWWKGLGEEGQTQVMTLVVGLGALAAVLVPLVGTLGVAGIVGSGLVTFVTGFVSLLSTIGGFIAPIVAGIGSIGAGFATMWSWLGPLGVVLEALALAWNPWVLGIMAAIGVFYAFRQEGDSVLDTLMRIATTGFGYLATAFAYVGGAASSLWAGLVAGVGPLDGIFSSLGPVFSSLLGTLGTLWTLLFGNGEGNMTAWENVGYVLGVVVGMALKLVIAGFEAVVTLLDTVVSALNPVIASVMLFAEGLFGLVTGSMDVNTAVGKMIMGLIFAASSVVVGALSLIVGAVEAALRLVSRVILAIPGAEALLGSDFSLGADAVGDFRTSLSRDLSEQIAGVDSAKTDRDAAIAGAAAPVVNVPAPVVEKVEVSSTVKVDSAEVARAQGTAATKGAARTGRQIPPRRRGAVLRGATGGVDFLSPSEVLG